MKRIKEIIGSLSAAGWAFIIFILLTSEQYVVTLYEAKIVHATQSLAPGVFDTTTAPRYKAELRFRLADSTIYWYNARTAGRKWFPIVRAIGPDTLRNLGILDTLLTNPSTGVYGFKSIRASTTDLTFTPTIDANSITYALTLAGTLPADRKVSGASHIMQWGDRDATSQMSEFRIDADKIRLEGPVVFSALGVATNADYVIPATVYNVELVTITAGRNVTVPTGIDGKIIEIWNRNSAGFNWTFVGTVKDLAENAITTLVNDSYYRLKYSSSASAWIKTN